MEMNRMTRTWILMRITERGLQTNHGTTPLNRSDTRDENQDRIFQVRGVVPVSSPENNNEN